MPEKGMKVKYVFLSINNSITKPLVVYSPLRLSWVVTLQASIKAQRPLSRHLSYCVIPYSLCLYPSVNLD